MRGLRHTCSMTRHGVLGTLGVRTPKIHYRSESKLVSVAPSAGHAQDPTGLVSDPQIKTLGFSTAFAFTSRTIKFRHNQDELPTTTDSASPPPMRASYLPMCLCPDRHRADVRLTRQMRGCVSASHRGGARLPKRRGGVARTKF